MVLSRDDMLMGMAELVAQRGTCARLQVGAVISRDARVISTGYNGAPKGMPHCDHSGEIDYQEHPENWPIPPQESLSGLDGWPDEYPMPPGSTGVAFVGATGKATYTFPGCDVAEHAERNAIAYAARYGVALDGSEVHVTHAPCLACSRTIINAGIVKVSYRIPYRLTEGIDLLGLAGVEVIDLGIAE